MIESDARVVEILKDNRGRFAIYLGAGASIEAGVPGAQQICDGIRLARLGDKPTPEKIARVERELRWSNPAQRYMAAIQAVRPSPAQRVDFFRSSLRGIPPSFVHHATAALMQQGYFKATAITTNFDKLLESAFVQQGDAECRPLRTDDELRYHDPSSGYFVLKLHGDCDTDNILNTEQETLLVTDKKREAVEGLLRRGGLLVLGSAAHESSVSTLFKQLLSKAASDDLLTFGLFWGVYVGASKPDGLDQQGIEKLVRERLETQVNPEIASLIEAHHKKTNPSFAFFPVWGGGNHLFDVVTEIRSRRLWGGLERYLDHEMRLRSVFRKAGLSQEGVEAHLNKLREQRGKMDRTFPDFEEARHVICEARRGGIVVRAIYADITERSMMSAPKYEKERCAVVSPEDTCISAGGGVAYSLLKKAGPGLVLPELGKLSRTPIPQGEVAITSGGNLPIHYVFHAAAVKINNDGTSQVTSKDVTRTMTNVLRLAQALDVTVVWAPLLGSGTAGFGRLKSLHSTLEAVAAWKRDDQLLVNVTILEESELHRHEVEQAFRKILLPSFTLTSADSSKSKKTARKSRPVAKKRATLRPNARPGSKKPRRRT